MSLLPAFLDLHGETAVIVGGGAVAVRRARTLLAAGLRVTVIAPELHAEFESLPVNRLGRTYQPGDLARTRVVVAATDSADVNAAVTAEARSVGALVNHAADAALGSLRFPGVAERAGVQVAVNTGRELPMLAQALTARITDLLPDAPQVDAWAARREAALILAAPERQAALDGLRGDIRRALGVSA